MSSIDIARKYNLYKSNDEAIAEIEDIQKLHKNYFSRRSSMAVPSPRNTPRYSIIKGQTIDDDNARNSFHQNFHVLKPLVLKEFSLKDDSIKTTEEDIEKYEIINQDIQKIDSPEIGNENNIGREHQSLSIISEHSSVSGFETENITKNQRFADFEGLNLSENKNKSKNDSTFANFEGLMHKENKEKSRNDQLSSNINIPETEKSLNSIGCNTEKYRSLDRHRPSQRIITNLLKESNDLSSPSSSLSPLIKARPIISALIIEQDILHSKSRIEIDKQKNVEENSKETQYEFKQEPIRRKSTRAGTMNTPHQFVDLDVFDEETLESFRKLCEQAGLQSTNRLEVELDNLPQHLKLELLKSFEGHDTKKCGNECIHLKRALNVRIKAKGIPYPIKKSSVIPRFS